VKKNARPAKAAKTPSRCWDWLKRCFFCGFAAFASLRLSEKKEKRKAAKIAKPPSRMRVGGHF